MMQKRRLGRKETGKKKGMRNDLIYHFKLATGELFLVAADRRVRFITTIANIGMM
jgi:hypothetical protein